MNKITEALKMAEKTLRDIIRVYKFETGTPVTALAAIREQKAELDKQEPIAYTVVGDGKFGEYKPGEHFDSIFALDYWANRGYDLLPVFVGDWK